MNIAMLQGNITKDAELKSGGKTPCLTFGVATNEKYRKADGTWQSTPTFHNCVLFGARATAMATWVKKGMSVTILGQIKNESYEKNGVKMYSSKIVVQDIAIPKGQSGGSDSGPTDDPAMGAPDAADDMPF